MSIILTRPVDVGEIRAVRVGRRSSRKSRPEQLTSDEASFIRAGSQPANASFAFTYFTQGP